MLIDKDCPLPRSVRSAISHCAPNRAREKGDLAINISPRWGFGGVLDFSYLAATLNCGLCSFTSGPWPRPSAPSS